MLVSEKDAIEGARILYPIGRIKAATSCHAIGYAHVAGNWRERVLADLIRRAEDVDADAVVGVNYKVEPVEGRDEHGLGLERVCATGIAVRLAQAA